MIPWELDEEQIIYDSSRCDSTRGNWVTHNEQDTMTMDNTHTSLSLEGQQWGQEHTNIWKVQGATGFGLEEQRLELQVCPVLATITARKRGTNRPHRRQLATM